MPVLIPPPRLERCAFVGRTGWWNGGEGFEPSSDPRARNGFRDRHEDGALQDVFVSCAPLCAPVSGWRGRAPGPPPRGQRRARRGCLRRASGGPASAWTLVHGRRPSGRGRRSHSAMTPASGHKRMTTSRSDPSRTPPCVTRASRRCSLVSHTHLDSILAARRPAPTTDDRQVRVARPTRRSHPRIPTRRCRRDQTVRAGAGR